MASKMNKKELYEAYKKLEQSHMKIEMELNDVKSDLSACEDELRQEKEYSKIAMVKNLEYEEDIEELKKISRRQQDLLNELDSDTIMKKYRDKVNKEKAEYANRVADYLKKRHEEELSKIRQMLS